MIYKKIHNFNNHIFNNNSDLYYDDIFNELECLIVYDFIMWLIK